MEKYSKILIYIFLLCVVNTILILAIQFNNYSKNKQSTKPSPISTTFASSKPSPIATVPSKDSPTTDMKSDINAIRSDVGVIKAEIRALRDAVENTGVIIQTPKP